MRAMTNFISSTNYPNGLCYGDGTSGCGVFVQGTNCKISGNDMWMDYQNIRNIGGCKKCGSYHREDKCLVTINYVSGCKNVL
jgi:hypothetical protein